VRNVKHLLILMGWVLFATPARASTGIPLKGHVYDASTCKGIARLVIQVRPSIKSNYPAMLVTTTDDNGDFEVEVREAGDYYLSVFAGLSQLYGHVITVQDQTPIRIPLQPAGQTPDTGTDCQQGSSSATTDCRPLEPVTLAEHKLKRLVSPEFRNTVWVYVRAIQVKQDPFSHEKRFAPFQIFIYPGSELDQKLTEAQLIKLIHKTKHKTTFHVQAVSDLATFTYGGHVFCVTVTRVDIDGTPRATMQVGVRDSR
jgi:hypothetical protein